MINLAISKLRPTSSFTLMDDSYDSLIWQDPNTEPPTLEEVNAQIIQCTKDLESAKQAKEVAKESALSKLNALGLTADEVKALLGVA